MNILFVSDNFPPETNAAASRVYERAVRWIEWGHGVTVITCQPNFPFGRVYEGYRDRWLQIEEIDGIRVVRVKTFMAPNQGKAKRILDFISFGTSATLFGAFLPRPDVVVATSPQFFSAVAGWMLSCLKRRPFVFELGDLWPASIAAVGVFRGKGLLGMIEAVELFLYRRAAAVVALTQAFKEDLVARGIDPDKIRVVRNGVELGRFSGVERDDALARELGLAGKFVVGYVGTHGLAHGMDTVMRVVEAAASRDDIRFLFVGAGAARDMMVRYARERSLPNVVFVDAQPKDRIPRYLALCDLNLIPLADRPVFSTVIPSKLFEAMAMGIPVLYFGPEGEASEIVERAGCGLVVAPPRVEDGLAGILRFVDGNGYRGKVAARSLAASRTHSRLHQASSMLDVLAEVTGLPSNVAEDLPQAAEEAEAYVLGA